LILGIFAMLYVRERRLWVWLSTPQLKAETAQAAPPACHATLALSSNRKTMDGDKEFEMLKSRMLQERS
jgi:cytochrome c biogenesis protein